jgi:hypothetical protein
MDDLGSKGHIIDPFFVNLQGGNEVVGWEEGGFG